MCMGDEGHAKFNIFEYAMLLLSMFPEDTQIICNPQMNAEVAHFLLKVGMGSPVKASKQAS